MTPHIAAYVYPGWHPIPERDESFYPGFTEWDLVYSCTPRFAGHNQPRLPLLGRYDDRDPVEVGRRVRLAAEHGIDSLVYGFFWCRGKRVFQEALDEGYLKSTEGSRFPFALMWANRMPRRVLPVRRADLPVIAGDRLVPSDVDDFVQLIAYLAERYFHLPNYLRVDEKPFFSIFDSTFFIRELGLAGAAAAIRAARAWLVAHGFAGMHLAAIEPASDLIGRVAEIGFDSITNYVLLPYWKGPFVQDYQVTAERRAGEWEGLSRAAGLPYFPSVSPGWDATPRAADFAAEISKMEGLNPTIGTPTSNASDPSSGMPQKYPWWPVVVGEHPDLFGDALTRAIRYSLSNSGSQPMVFVASLNEWSEGHYLEPDTRFGNGWLEAVQRSRAGSVF